MRALAKSVWFNDRTGEIRRLPRNSGMTKADLWVDCRIGVTRDVSDFQFYDGCKDQPALRAEGFVEVMVTGRCSRLWAMKLGNGEFRLVARHGNPKCPVDPSDYTLYEDYAKAFLKAALLHTLLWKWDDVRRAMDDRAFLNDLALKKSDWLSGQRLSELLKFLDSETSDKLLATLLLRR